jgi:RimJ/RimL family protein N-acetyltransferase
MNEIKSSVNSGVLPVGDGTHVSLREFNDDDISLFACWLEQDYIKKWYDPIEDWLYEARNYQGEFSWIHAFIVELDGTPIGFCQYYDCYDAKELEDWYEVNTPGETYSIDYLIGEQEYLGKGYGKAIVKNLVSLAATLGAKKVIVDPDKDNKQSVGVLLANGFVFDNKLGYFTVAMDTERLKWWNRKDL